MRPELTLEGKPAFEETSPITTLSDCLPATRFSLANFRCGLDPDFHRSIAYNSNSAPCCRSTVHFFFVWLIVGGIKKLGAP